ncbi:MAG: hypothetical protein Q9187_009474 [Circinaria calcarea]
MSETIPQALSTAEELQTDNLELESEAHKANDGVVDNQKRTHTSSRPMAEQMTGEEPTLDTTLGEKTISKTPSSLSIRQENEDGDIEKGAIAHTSSDKAGLPDPNVVDWDGPDDPANPLNWSEKVKWSLIALLSCMTFIT